MKKLRISDSLSLPIDLVTQRTSILGRTRSGKSHTAGVIVEEVLKARQQVVILDPKGDWWGLRSSADGKSAGLPITIMGGKHGDIPLEPTAGALVADIIVNEGISVVLDLSLFESKADEIRFVTALLDRFYRKNTQPVLLVIDEADTFAPQRPERNETVMLNRMETICRRGAGRGIGVVLVSQRSASIHKGCLSQTELMIAHQTTAPQDRKAVELWVVAHGDEEQHESFMKRIPKLPIGTAIVWSPSWLNIYEEVGVRAKETYDSSASPRVGKRRRPPKVLAQVDLDRLKKHMAETIQKAQRDDPNALRAEIARLLANLRREEAGRADAVRRAVAAEKRTPVEIEKKIEKRVVKPIVFERDLWRIRKAIEQLEKLRVKIHKELGKINMPHVDLMVKLSKAIEISQQQAESASTWVRVPAEPMTVKATAEKSRTVITKIQIVNPEAVKKAGYKTAPKVTQLRDAPRLRRGETEILRACVMVWTGASEAKLGVLSGFPSGGSTFKTYVNTLKRNGLIANNGSGLSPTDLGASVIGPVDPMPTETPELVALWKKRLRAGECEILDMFVERYPKGVARRDIAKNLDPGPDDFPVEEKFTESTVNTYVNTLKRCGLIVQEGEVFRASETLFGAEVKA
jgi:hypothetical protein